MTDTKRAFDPFHARDSFDTGSGQAWLYRLTKLEEAGLTRISALPYLDPGAAGIGAAELRRLRGDRGRRSESVPAGRPHAVARRGDPFQAGPGRAAGFHRRAGCVVDLAAMRSAMERLGGDPSEDQPADSRGPGDRPFGAGRSFRLARCAGRATSGWSSSATASGTSSSRWGQKAFDNFRVVPPAVGIVHQVNLEFLAKCVFLRQDAGRAAWPCPTRWWAPTATPR